MERCLKGKKKTVIMGGTVYFDDILKLRKFTCSNGFVSYGVSMTYLSEFHCFQDNPVFTYHRYFDDMEQRDKFYKRVLHMIRKNIKIKQPFKPHVFENGNKIEKVIDGWCVYNKNQSKFIYDPNYEKVVCFETTK